MVSYDLCNKCEQPKTYHDWCQMCNAKRFQQNFKNWTSGNDDVDEFIQKIQLEATSNEQVIEWIEHDRFEDIEYLVEGGFGTVYKAVWKDRPIMRWDSKNNQWNNQKGKIPVALKCLRNSQNVKAEFLKEIKSHIMVHELGKIIVHIVQCYGITKDPKTNDFMMVMEYAQNGNLRKHLDKDFTSISWSEKLSILTSIAHALKLIHDKGLIHHDFHCGNILKNTTYHGVLYTQITDLGLCRPANVTFQQGSDKQIYGVLPYIAPEVLKGKEYTQASDIYGFGIIAYELCTGLPPYHDIAHDESLAIEICHGLRPKSNYKIPQLILDKIQQCWDADPLKRPKAMELKNLFLNSFESRNSTINEQIKEADEINGRLSSLIVASGVLSYTTHVQAIYTSRLLDFKNLPEPKNSVDNSHDN